MIDVTKTGNFGELSKRKIKGAMRELQFRDHGGVVQTVPLTKLALSPDEDLPYAVKTARSISKWLQ